MRDNKYCLFNIRFKLDQTLTKAWAMTRKKLEVKEHKMPFKLRDFYRICKHHLQKMLNSMIKLRF